MRNIDLKNFIAMPHCSVREHNNWNALNCRRHIKADAQQTQIFMEAWAKYAIDLSKQMGLKGVKTAGRLGSDMPEQYLEHFSDEQLAQLYELYVEAKKPIDPEKDPHLANQS